MSALLICFVSLVIDIVALLLDLERIVPLAVLTTRRLARADF